MKEVKNYSLLEHNTFGFDAKCSCFYEYENELELLEIRRLLENSSVDFLHIGGGSNLLFVGDFRGAVLHSAIKGKEVIAQNQEQVVLRVGAGEVWDEFVGWCVDNGYYGLENLSYIPGEVGAAAVQNIGAYGNEICDYLESVEAFDMDNGQIVQFSKAECDYAYRHSFFKTREAHRYIIMHVHFCLTNCFQPNLNYAALANEICKRGWRASDLTPKALRNLIIDIRREKLPDPEKIGNAGSFFMNPVVPIEKLDEIRRDYQRVPAYPVDGGGYKIPAAWLIEQCGWKGKKCGTVGVYDKQALVLVHFGGGSGLDICNLSDAIRRSVKEKFGIEITPEVNFIRQS